MPSLESDTHQAQFCEDDGFREGLNPSYALHRLLRFASNSSCSKYLSVAGRLS
jgi:hypothetical protein